MQAMNRSGWRWGAWTAAGLLAACAGAELDPATPKAGQSQAEARAVKIVALVGAAGEYTWNGEIVSDQELEARMNVLGAMELQSKPDLNITADEHVRYERVAGSINLAQKIGVATLGIIQPGPS